MSGKDAEAVVSGLQNFDLVAHPLARIFRIEESDGATAAGDVEDVDALGRSILGISFIGFRPIFISYVRTTAIEVLCFYICRAAPSNLNRITVKRTQRSQHAAGRCGPSDPELVEPEIVCL